MAYKGYKGYKPMSERAKRTSDTFTMGPTRTIRQRNGVMATMTKAVRDDGMVKRDILIFANGSRATDVAEAVAEGSTSTLVGKYSQPTVFVAMGVAGAT